MLDRRACAQSGGSLSAGLSLSPRPTSRASSEAVHWWLAWSGLLDRCVHISARMTLLRLFVVHLTTLISTWSAEGGQPPPGHCASSSGNAQLCSVSVLDFGADNFQHNTSSQIAFNAAVRHLSSLPAPQGGMGSVMGAFYAPTIYVPSGMYLFSDQVNFSNSPLKGELGSAILKQLNPDKSILVNRGVWRWSLESLSLVGGLHHVWLGNMDDDMTAISIDKCTFANASGTVIKTDPEMASAVVTVSNSQFYQNQQIAVNWCTTMVFKDVWVGGCGTVNCSAGLPLFDNWSGLFIERMTGAGDHGIGTRWIDQNGHEAQLSVRDSRFGGEGGGMLIVLNRASFLCSPNDCHCTAIGHCNCSVGRAGGCDMPPGRGPLPENTHLTNMPQGSSILIDNCQIDSYAAVPEWNASIYLEQIPQVLIVRESLGNVYTNDPMTYVNGSLVDRLNLSMVRVSPLLDLDGAQLDYAARFPNTLKYHIGADNDYDPSPFNDLPQQLQPYSTSTVYGDAAPTVGVWRAGQVVNARLNSSAARDGVIGWRCVAGGKPGAWSVWKM